MGKRRKLLKIVGNVNTLELIRNAFDHRRMPALFLISEQLAAHECDDVMRFWGKPWSSLTAAQLEKHVEAVFWFTPEAFCYYLPGILSVSIRENKPWLVVNQSLVNMLNRSPDPESWDDFFSARWPRLTTMECEATQAWLLWLSSVDDGSFPENALGRAFDTLELVKHRTIP